MSHSSPHSTALSPALAALTPERIRALCGPLAQATDIEVLASTGSTNSDLLARIAARDLAPRHLLLAHEQTAGRGRAGRSWLSAPESSLTFSLAWLFQRRMQDLVGLSLAVGVALAQALKHFQVDVTLKWPNDVLRGGRKLAGVLIETAAEPAGGTWAVIGIGLNVQMPPADDATANAAQLGIPVARDVLMAALLDELAMAMVEFEEQGFAAFCARWNELHAWTGQHVVMLDRGQATLRGRAVGVDEIGRLLVDTPGGRVAAMAGDVSLRTLAED